MQRAGALCWPLAALAALALAPATHGSEAVFGLDEVEPGQRGHGLTVVRGTETERFEVEVLGVLREVRPDTSYILARLSGLRLEETGVVGGMSGSPVYLDGRLAGAVAFTWAFAQEAIAGITPVESMRRLSELPGGGRAAGGPPVELERILGGEVGAGLLEEQLVLLAPRSLQGAAAPVAWAGTGLGPQTRELFERAVGPLAPAGAAGAGGGETSLLGPGSPVSAVLMDGDLRLAATGTVTERRGDEILAFGHPFLGRGPLRLPMAAAEIVAVVPSSLLSFKLSNLGPVIGAFDQDRVAGIRGRVGLEAPTVPVLLHVQGSQARTFELRLADEPQLTPLLLAVGALGGLEAVGHLAGPQGLDLAARFDLGPAGELTMRQSFDGAAAPLEAASFLLAVASFLTQNRLEPVGLVGVEVELAQSPEPRTVRVVGAHSERSRVRPGDQVVIHLELAGGRGGPFRKQVPVQVPKDLPAGRYSLLVGDGWTLTAARLALQPAPPVRLSQALRLLGSYHSRRDLVVLGVYAGQGLSVAGEVLPRLPGSVISVWGAAGTMGARPLRQAVREQHVETLDWPLEGVARIDLEVQRREPWTTDEESPPEPRPDEEPPAEEPPPEEPPLPSQSPDEDDR